MSKSAGQHVSTEQLLCYADGELPSRQSSQVRLHLEACWQCRAELEEIHKAISRCVAYRREVLQQELPAPPRGWTNLYDEMAEIDARSGWSWRLRAAEVFRGPAMRRWAPVAAAVALAVVVSQKVSHTPTVQAAELLRRAEQAALSQPASPKRIQIRTRTRRMVRTLPAPAVAAAAREAEPLEARFQAARYDWRDPLSARTFSRWRDGLTGATDQVSGGEGAYRVRTRPASGDLTEATLALRVSDLRPVEGTFRFRDDEFVEITELPAEPAAPAGEQRVAAPAVRKTPASVLQPPPAELAASPEATLADELRVIAALQRLGADLGEAVEVVRQQGQIRVEVAGMDPARRAQLEAAVGGIAGTEVREAAAGAEIAKRTQAALPEGASSSLQDRIAETLGGRNRLEEIGSAALGETDAVMARAYALRRLAARFPRDREAELSAADQGLLHSLFAEHAVALRRHSAALERQASPLLGKAASLPAPPSGLAWQDEATQLFEASRRVERLVAALFGGAAPQGPPESLPGELTEAVGILRSRAEAYGSPGGQ